MATPFKKGRRGQILSTNKENNGDIVANDDNAEKLQRRQEKVLDLARNSPKRLSLSSRSDINGNGLTNSMIVEHYTNCIKLSTENKITVKNAFGLHLIDYMAEMIKRKDSQFDNFQVASCTLDASAKIYAYRVDCVHADTLKIASSLSRTNEENEMKRKNSNLDTENDDDLNDDGQPKKKKRVKRGRTIEDNLKNINATKLEMQREVDPVLCRISRRFLKDGSSSAVFLTSLCHYKQDYSLILDSQTEYSFKPKSDHSGSVQIDATELRPLFDNVLKEGSRICPAFDGFKLGSWEVGDKPSLNGIGHQEFDAPTDDHALECGDYSDNMNHDNSDDDDRRVENLEQGNVTNKSQPSGTSLFDQISSDGMIMQALSTEPNEYSYFKPQFLSAWAGPSHWQIRPRERVNRSKEPRVQRTKKPALVIDFKEDIDLDVFFKKSRTSLCLAKATVQNWSEERTTLPEDIHYEEKYFLQLFLNKAFTVDYRYRGGLTCKQDSEHGHYNYNNDNDVDNFCPPADFQNTAYSENDNADINESGNFPMTQTEIEDENPDMLNLTGENLIEKPYQVPTFEIPYPRAAKRVNVKHVKHCMWKLLSEDMEITQGKQTTFRELYEALPTILMPQTAKDISVPIAINCLLHLANEKVLKIQSNETLDNMTIEMQDVEDVATQEVREAPSSAVNSGP